MAQLQKQICAYLAKMDAIPEEESNLEAPLGNGQKNNPEFRFKVEDIGSKLKGGSAFKTWMG